jgi:hypothetical protein
MTETPIQELVDQLVAAEEWPDPNLLQAILDRGEAGIEPLIAVLETDDANYAKDYATQILGSLGATQAIPVVAGLFRRFDGDVLELYMRALAMFGAEAIEPALEVVRDPALRWYQRAMASNAAVDAAGDDPALRLRVSAELRTLLADYLGRITTLNAADSEVVTSLVVDLAGLADPESRPLIEAAFEAELVDPFMIDRKTYQDMYRRPERWRFPRQKNWLAEYRREYTNHQADLRRRARAEPFTPRSLTTPSASISKPGRNNPCWCGSGKKYKHCHLQSDQSSV